MVILIVLAAVLAIGVGTGAYLVYGRSQPYEYTGGYYDPPKPAPSLGNATKTDGTPFRLEDYRGKVVMFYFGYTHCPDYCPTTLGEWMNIKDAMGDRADDVVFAMVTVDPERDTPEVLRQYLDFFDPSFIGVEIPADQLHTVAGDWYVTFSTSDADSAGGYLVDHSASTLVVGPDGKLRGTYAFGTDEVAIARDFKHLLDE